MGHSVHMPQAKLIKAPLVVYLILTQEARQFLLCALFIDSNGL